MLSFTGCVVILFGLVGLYGYNNAVRKLYKTEIRKYKQSDCEELAKLFYHTVHTVNAKDYTEGQLNVWADGKVNLEKWNISLKKNGNKATITAKKKGIATITAKAGKSKLQCKVRVSGKKVLLAYFSRTGNNKKLANYIQKSIGGDLVQIKTKKAYPSNYNQCVSQAEKELEDNIRPEITIRVKNFEKYDEVALGHPIWWGMALPNWEGSAKGQKGQRRFLLMMTIY